ncbi:MULTISPECIES: hypothetical protein [unclassified Saccharothrix]|uniref:hypothetical protein n=1 Tax=unclassified Saccharothrix TaxID=2593673 RepID=UPI00307E7DBB
MAGRLDPVDPGAPAELRVLAERLRTAMTDAEYRVSRVFAADAGVSPATLSDALGGSKTPSWDTVTKLLKACDIPPDTRWKRMWEAAQRAEREWRGTTTAEPVEVRRPGALSIRPPIGGLPAHVRGRDDVLDHISALVAEPQPVVQVLHGLGGCGKTTIALEVARRADCPVFWISASQRGGLVEGLKQVAHEIGVPDDQVERAWAGFGSATDLLWRHLDAAPHPWLLVVDNADEPHLLASAGGVPGDGTGWVRPSHRGTTVVTSRVGAREVWGSQARLHHVDVLGEEDAADVLIDLAGHAGGRGAARALAERLGGLPLALRSAGTYLGRTSRGGGLLRRESGRPARAATFDAYRQALGDSALDLLDEGVPHLNDVERLEQRHRGLVSRTWEMGLDLLEAQGYVHARALMRLMSCFASAPLPADLLDEAVLAEAAGRAVVLDDVGLSLEALVEQAMLVVTEVDGLTGTPDHVGDSPLVCLLGHRLVLEAVSSRLRALPAAEQAPTWRAAARLIARAATPAPEEAENWPWWRLLLPHVAALVAQVPDDAPVFREVLDCALRGFAYMSFSGYWADAKRYSQVVLSRARVLPEDDPLLLSTRHRAVLTSEWTTENHAEFRRILDAQTRVLGADHPETLITHHNAAVLLGNLEGHAHAVAEMHAVARTRTSVLGATNPYTLVSRDELVRMLSGLGHHEEAEAEIRAVIAACRRERGHSDHYTLTWQARLARELVKRGATAVALDEFERVRTEPITSNSARGEVADVLKLLGRPAQAAVEYREVLRHLRSTGLDQDNRYRKTLRAYADCLVEQGLGDDAIAAYDEEIARHARSDEHHAKLRLDRAKALIKASRQPEAEEELRDQLAAPATDGVAAAVHWVLADLLEVLNRPAEALECYRAGLEVEQRLYEPRHRDVLVSRRRIIRMRRKVGEIDAAGAIAEFTDLLTDYLDAHGPTSTSTAWLREELAGARRAAGDIAGAEAELRELVDLCREHHQPHDHLTRHVLWTLARTLITRDRWAEALPVLEECLAAELAALPPDAWEPLRTRRRIAQGRHELGLATAGETAAEYRAILPALEAHEGPDGSLPTKIREALAELQA